MYILDDLSRRQKVLTFISPKFYFFTYLIDLAYKHNILHNYFKSCSEIVSYMFWKEQYCLKLSQTFYSIVQEIFFILKRATTSLDG